MNRRTRILLLILAAVLYFCSMAFGAESAVETTHSIVSTREVFDYNDSSTSGQSITFFTTPDQALPVARLKRVTQSVSPVKVTNERRNRSISYVALPSTVAQYYRQCVTSYLHYSYIIYLSLPPEEIAFPFTAFW